MNLICFGHLPWSYMWKRNQNIVFNLKNKGIFNKVLFLNPYVRVTDLLFKYNLQTKNITNLWSWKRILPKIVSKDIIAITTVFIGPNLLFNIINKIISNMYLFLIKKNHCKEYFILLINDFDPDREIYYKKLIPLAYKVIVDISDDFLGFAEKPDKLVRMEKFIDYCISNADIVLCINQFVYNKFSNNNTKTKFFIFKNGIKFDDFIRNQSKEDPFEILKIKHPIIGYMGIMTAGRIDEEILNKLLLKFTDCSFVFIGQEVSGFCKKYIKKYKNFYYISTVPYQEMIGYVRQFDVAIIPHQLDALKGNDLLKTHVFMAAKVPTVSTDAAGLDKYSEVLNIATTPQKFCDDVGKCLKNPDLSKIEKGFISVQSNTWDKKIIILINEFKLRGII